MCVWYHVLDSMFFLNINQQPVRFFSETWPVREWPLVAWQGETSWASFAPRSGEPQIQQTQKDAKEIHRGYLRECMYHVIYVLAAWPISNISNISNIWQAKHWNAIKGSSFCRFQMAKVRKRHLLGYVAGRQNQGKSRQVFFCPVQKPHPKVPLCMVIGWCLYTSTLQWVVFT